jgi:MoaA/NifB/PqqE/SkfB family radical SAM enzyme
MSKEQLKTEKQDILVGSSKINSGDKKFDRIKYFENNMQYNKAYLSYLEKNNIQDLDGKILHKFIEDYKNYRDEWTNSVSRKNNNKPLSIDIETAAICDLACPHCSREYIITPDKVMHEELYHKLIEETVNIGVPSIKLNWRGEPLLNPKLSKMILYAKQKGVLEVLINTNAVSLTEKKSTEIIESGLDVMIYSFDGGSKKTYEKMRPGRFIDNKFEKVYENIKRFSEIKKKSNSKFPVTKIQMILTEDSRNEVNNFYDLFSSIVDEVTVTQYNERGGNFQELTDDHQKLINEYLNLNKLPKETPHLVDFDNNIFISRKRKPCEQIFQRLMITFDGRVGMCCHDWGAQHGIGFVDEKAFNQTKLTMDVEKKIKDNAKGFKLLSNAKKPHSYNEPSHKVESLSDLWNGHQLQKVRNLHLNEKVNDVDVCKRCTFKDTYEWEKIN